MSSSLRQGNKSSKTTKSDSDLKGAEKERKKVVRKTLTDKEVRDCKRGQDKSHDRAIFTNKITAANRWTRALKCLVALRLNIPEFEVW